MSKNQLSPETSNAQLETHQTYQRKENIEFKPLVKQILESSNVVRNKGFAHIQTEQELIVQMINSGVSFK